MHMLDPIIAQGLKGVDFYEPMRKSLHFRLGIKDSSIFDVKELFLTFYMLNLQVKEHSTL